MAYVKSPRKTHPITLFYAYTPPPADRWSDVREHMKDFLRFFGQKFYMSATIDADFLPGQTTIAVNMTAGVEAEVRRTIERMFRALQLEFITNDIDAKGETMSIAPTPKKTASDAIIQNRTPNRQPRKARAPRAPRAPRITRNGLKHPMISE